MSILTGLVICTQLGAISTIDGGTPGDDSEVASDNDIDDNGAGTPGTGDNPADADDYDPEVIQVTQEFDLALTKEVVTPGPYVPGGIVTYNITVYNQGTLDATGVVVTETPPTGMTNVDPDWTANMYTVGTVLAGTSQTIQVDMQIDINFQGSSLVNNAEITEGTNALGLEDEDGAISMIDGGLMVI